MDKITCEINEFDEWAVKWVKYKIDDALLNKQKVLPVIINSYGGEVYSLMAIVDILKASGLKIITIALGKAMSCGAFLFGLGEERYISENTSLMIHEVAGATRGKISESETYVKEARILSNKIFNLLNKNTNNQDGFFENLVKENNNADLYLNAQQALDCNLATNIGLPKMVDIFGDTELETELKNDDVVEYDKRICMESKVRFYASLKDNNKFSNNNINSFMEGQKTMFKLEKEKYLNDTKPFTDNQIPVMEHKDNMFESEQTYKFYLDGRKDLLDMKNLFTQNKTQEDDSKLTMEKIKQDTANQVNELLAIQNKKFELTNAINSLRIDFKITPAVADKHLESLKTLSTMNELSNVEVFVNSLKDMPSNKSFSTSQFISDKKDDSNPLDLSVTKDDIDKFVGKNNHESDLISKESVLLAKSIESYASKNNIDISTEKNYLDVYNKVIAIMDKRSVQ